MTGDQHAMPSAGRLYAGQEAFSHVTVDSYEREATTLAELLRRQVVWQHYADPAARQRSARRRRRGPESPSASPHSLPFAKLRRRSLARISESKTGSSTRGGS